MTALLGTFVLLDLVPFVGNLEGKIPATGERGARHFRSLGFPKEISSGADYTGAQMLALLTEVAAVQLL
jgi:hypothetical protein